MAKFVTIPRALLVALIIIAVLAVSVCAYTEWRRYNASITVVEGIEELEVYVDPNFTIPLVGPLVWSSIQRGTSLQGAWYVKNIGIEDVTVAVKYEAAAGFPINIAFAPNTAFTLSSGQTATVTYTMDIPVSVPLGTHDFDIVFYEP